MRLRLHGKDVGEILADRKVEGWTLVLLESGVSVTKKGCMPHVYEAQHKAEAVALFASLTAAEIDRVYWHVTGSVVN